MRSFIGSSITHRAPPNALPVFGRRRTKLGREVILYNLEVLYGMIKDGIDVSKYVEMPTFENMIPNPDRLAKAIACSDEDFASAAQMKVEVFNLLCHVRRIVELSRSSRKAELMENLERKILYVVRLTYGTFPIDEVADRTLQQRVPNKDLYIPQIVLDLFDD